MDWLNVLMALFFAGALPLAFFFAGCSCCGGGCTIASDDFAVDDLATNWDTRSGSPTISGGKLNAGAGTNLVIHNTAAGVSATAVFATVDFTATSSTDVGRLIIAYTNDSNYWFCEAQPGGVNGTVKLFERSGGANTQRGSTATIAGWTTATGRTLRMCYANGIIRATVIGAGGNTVSYSASVTVASTKAGIGCSEVGTVTFDNFSFEKHYYEDASCRTCTTCSTCDDGITPDQVQIDLSNISQGSCIALCDCCTAINGTYILDSVGACCWHTVSGTSCTNCYGCGQWKFFAHKVLTITSSGDLRFHVVGPSEIMTVSDGCYAPVNDGTNDFIIFKQASAGLDTDCVGWNAYSIPFDSDIVSCDTTTALCEVTAL